MSLSLSEEEKLLLENLGLIKIKGKTEVIPEYKIIKGTAKCKLCGTITVQVIKMMKIRDGSWIKKEEIPVSQEIEETLPYEEYNTEVRFCWACRDKLMRKEKSELVEIIINLYNPVISRQEIWKEVRKLKEENKNEQ